MEYLIGIGIVFILLVISGVINDCNSNSDYDGW